MDLLEDIKRAYNNAVAQRQAAIRMRDHYNGIARDIGIVYKSMKAVKTQAETYARTYSKFASKTYDSFCGNNFDTKYIPTTENAQYAIASLVSEIDSNLDALNNEKTRYENLALQQSGIIGGLASKINSLWTRIENWAN